MIKIRKAKIEDAQDIYNIADKLRLNLKNPQDFGFLVYTLTIKQYISRIKDTDFFYVALDDNNKIKSFLMCYDNKTLKRLIDEGKLNHENGIIKKVFKQQDNFIFGDQIGVIPNTILKGIGKSMMKKLFSDMHIKGINNMFVAILHKPILNNSSISFVKKIGFKFISEVTNSDNLVWGIYKLNISDSKLYKN